MSLNVVAWPIEHLTARPAPPLRSKLTLARAATSRRLPSPVTSTRGGPSSGTLQQADLDVASSQLWPGAGGRCVVLSSSVIVPTPGCEGMCPTPPPAGEPSTQLPAVPFGPPANLS